MTLLEVSTWSRVDDPFPPSLTQNLKAKSGLAGLSRRPSRQTAERIESVGIGHWVVKLESLHREINTMRSHEHPFLSRFYHAVFVIRNSQMACDGIWKIIDVKKLDCLEML